MAEEIIKGIETKQEVVQTTPHHNHDKKLMLAAGILLILLAVGGLTAAIVAKRFVGSHVGNKIGMERNTGNSGRGKFGAGMGGRMMVRNNATGGKVTAVEGKVLTVDASGTSIKVQISDITRFPLSSNTAIKVGDQLAVFGEKDANGIVQATRIIVNPSQQ